MRTLELIESGRFRKHRTRRKGKLTLIYWRDCLTGHLYVLNTTA
jgi:hypothetical protein